MRLLGKLEIKSKEKIIEFLSSQQTGRISSIDENGYPQIIPMNFVFINDAVYMHSHIRGEKLGNIRRNQKAGFEVGLNIMYLSEWDQYDDFFDQFKGIENHIDYLYMADSYGAVLPDYIVKTVKKLKSITSVKLGYHGHNNLEMGLINALKAIEHGVEIIDASITGMGRGAGNLKTELLLTYLAAENLKEVNFEHLDALVNQFEGLQATYQWGNNLAYMVSGANSIPQKEVMN